MFERLFRGDFGQSGAHQRRQNSQRQRRRSDDARPLLRAHKFRVGQTVLYTSSPISRPGASGTYKVVKLLPSDGDDYQYRIKNSGEAFERVAKESQLEVDH